MDRDARGYAYRLVDQSQDAKASSCCRGAAKVGRRLRLRRDSRGAVEGGLAAADGSERGGQGGGRQRQGEGAGQVQGRCWEESHEPFEPCPRTWLVAASRSCCRLPHAAARAAADPARQAGPRRRADAVPRSERRARLLLRRRQAAARDGRQRAAAVLVPALRRERPRHGRRRRRRAKARAAASSTRWWRCRCRASRSRRRSATCSASSRARPSRAR